MKSEDFRDRLMDNGKHVALTKVGDYIISTVLLPEHLRDLIIKHPRPNGKPLAPKGGEDPSAIFETMV